MKLRQRRNLKGQMILTGAAIFLCLCCFTALTAFTLISSALSADGGESPLPNSYTVEESEEEAPSPLLEQQKSTAVTFSEEDYQNRVLVEIEDTEGNLTLSAPTPPQDENGDYLLSDTAIPQSYSMEIIRDGTTYTYKVENRTEEIAYETVYTNTTSLAKGVEVVKNAGTTGLVSYTVTTIYQGDTLVETRTSEKTVEREVSPRKILRGIGQAVTGSDGSVYAYTEKLDVKAYCYYAGEDGGSYSATGKKLEYGMIAVDPSVIPLGTTLYIDAPGTKWDGVYVAEDTGGNIKGNIIDVYFPTYAQAKEFSTRYVTVYILEN